MGFTVDIDSSFSRAFHTTSRYDFREMIYGPCVLCVMSIMLVYCVKNIDRITNMKFSALHAVFVPRIHKGTSDK